MQWVIEKEHPGPVEVAYEDEHAVLRYENGLVIHGCKYSGEEVGAVGGACYIGTEGYIAVDRENIVSNPPEILKVQLKPEDERPYVSPIHAGNFLECIRTRKQTICNAETAHRSMSLVLLAGIATQLKRKMTWDPVKEVFVGDEQANRLLSYARRPGWKFEELRPRQKAIQAPCVPVADGRFPPDRRRRFLSALKFASRTVARSPSSRSADRNLRLQNATKAPESAARLSREGLQRLITDMHGVRCFAGL